ncbi:hypothetical protein SUGI_0545590 [Cryptomeria japonica]|uniref:protopine O-dealkylase-like n=1 Tax=Cryptomeria japonica TaxID=3369 RepID=UPI002408A55D|nr:protopine O-dealkylase-like [Cryptomeria japonica]GLJ27802.1 hypothetical protein SUGI_0545590 [Cryptomeria japonica]
MVFDPSNETSKRFSVPIVQELASQNLQSLPQRYIRSEKERPITFPYPHPDIPIIDMDMLLRDSDLCRQKKLEKLGITCQQWGFFQVERMKAIVREFIELPLKEKLKYEMQDIEGHVQSFIASDGQILDWADIVSLTTLPLENRKMDFWPTTPSDLRYVKRMNYYPPCPRPDLVLGLSPHSDGNTLTVLLQDDETVGLQICKDGEWIPVNPIPGALVINIGDMLEGLSNGLYKSIEHRAVTNIDRDRISIAMFYCLDKETEVGPVPELIDELHPCQYNSCATKIPSRIVISLQPNLENRVFKNLKKLQTKTTILIRSHKVSQTMQTHDNRSSTPPPLSATTSSLESHSSNKAITVVCFF